MPQHEFDADAALNRILQAVAPFRANVHGEEVTAELAQGQVAALNTLTQEGIQAAMEALGEPLTEQKAFALLLAAVLRLADVWNGQGEQITIPDTFPEDMQ